MGLTRLYSFVKRSDKGPSDKLRRKKGGKKEKNEVIWKPNGESKASWSPGLPKEKKNIQTNAYNIEAQK